MKSIRFLVATCSAAIVMLAVALTVGLAAGSNIEVVTESDVTRQQENTPPTDNWVLYTRTPASLGTFVTGPETPPLGVGSLQLETPTGADKVFLFNYDHVNTQLSDITALSYSTYRYSSSVTGHPAQVPAINIEVDVNGDAPGGFTTLVFEPVYNTNQGNVVDDQWQTWNAYGNNAFWWSTRDIPGVCAFTCYVSWNTIVAANPDAVILGGFGVNQGSGNGGLKAAVDALTINTADTAVTYNFDPYKIATSKDDCKGGQWQTYKRADGSSFKNQGQCVSYTNTGK